VVPDMLRKAVYCIRPLDLTQFDNALLCSDGRWYQKPRRETGRADNNGDRGLGDLMGQPRCAQRLSSPGLVSRRSCLGFQRLSAGNRNIGRASRDPRVGNGP
jgi:hypothetical protein